MPSRFIIWIPVGINVPRRQPWGPQWICASCGARAETNDEPCRNRAGERFARLEDTGTSRVDSTASVTWVCQECGETSPKNDTPCRVCGSFQYHAVNSDDLEDEWDGVSDPPDATPTTSSGSNSRLYGNIAFVGMLFVPALQFFAPLVGGLVALAIFAAIIGVWAVGFGALGGALGGSMAD